MKLLFLLLIAFNIQAQYITDLKAGAKSLKELAPTFTFTILNDTIEDTAYQRVTQFKPTKPLYFTKHYYITASLVPFDTSGTTVYRDVAYKKDTISITDTSAYRVDSSFYIYFFKSNTYYYRVTEYISIYPVSSLDTVLVLGIKQLYTPPTRVVYSPPAQATYIKSNRNTDALGRYKNNHLQFQYKKGIINLRRPL